MRQLVQLVLSLSKVRKIKLETESSRLRPYDEPVFLFMMLYLNWEQGRDQPDVPSKVLNYCVAKGPKVGFIGRHSDILATVNTAKLGTTD